MDLLFTTYRTPQSRLVRYFTGSHWTHVSGVVEGTVYDFNMNRKKVEDLHDFCWNTQPVDIDIIRNVDINSKEFLDVFENAKYENLQGLCRIISKHRTGRDLEEIFTSSNHYTCSSLIGRKLELPHHYSQCVPDDFYSKENKLSNKN